MYLWYVNIALFWFQQLIYCLILFLISLYIFSLLFLVCLSFSKIFKLLSTTNSLTPVYFLEIYLRSVDFSFIHPLHLSKPFKKTMVYWLQQYLPLFPSFSHHTFIVLTYLASTNTTEYLIATKGLQFPKNPNLPTTEKPRSLPIQAPVPPLQLVRIFLSFFFSF